MTARKKLLLGAAVVLAVLAAGGAVFALTRPPADVSNPDVEFHEEPTETPAPDIPEPPKGSKKADPLRNFVWADYGYSKDRRKYLPASLGLRPPFWRVWTNPGKVLIEFPPIMAEGKLFVLKNNGALHAIDKRTGKTVWKRKLGLLAAASPAYGNGRLFVTLLQRGKGKDGAVAALRAEGRQDPLAPDPALAQRVLAGVRQRPHLLRLRERHRLRAARRRRRRALEVQGLGRGQERPRAGQRQALLRRLRGARVRAAPDERQPLWSTGTKGAVFGLRAGQFYSTPAVAYGRVYIGNTDGKMYSFSSENGKLAWTKGTGSYVYSSPAVAHVPGGRPTVYFGSYDGVFYALDARTGRVRWQHRDGGKISGGATVVGDIVYFSNLGKKDTTGLGARTGREVFHIGRGAYNPVISDGRTIFLTGYTSIYALRPKR